MKGRIAEWREKVKFADRVAKDAATAKPSAFKVGDVEVFVDDDGDAVIDDGSDGVRVIVLAKHVPAIAAHLLAMWGGEIPDGLAGKDLAIAKDLIRAVRPMVVGAHANTKDEMVRANAAAWLEDAAKCIGPIPETAPAVEAEPVSAAKEAS